MPVTLTDVWVKTQEHLVICWCLWDLLNVFSSLDWKQFWQSVRGNKTFRWCERSYQSAASRLMFNGLIYQLNRSTKRNCWGTQKWFHAGLICHVPAAHPEDWLTAAVSLFSYKLFYHLLCSAENVHTSSHTDSPSSRWKTEPSFPPCEGHFFALFKTKILKCFPDWMATAAAAVWRLQRRLG